MSATSTKNLMIGVDVSDQSTYVIAQRLADGTALIREAGVLQGRIVRSPQRKRKLNRRGDTCLWDPAIGAWTWQRRVPNG